MMSRLVWMVALALVTRQPAAEESAVSAIAAARAKIVKLHGAGGARRLEAYQSGILVSPEGQILTVASHVLSGGEVRATFDDGTTRPAKLVAQDLGRDLALLEVEGGAPAWFDLETAAPAPSVGAPILALSNLFDIAAGNEPVSAQSGVVSGRAPLAARQGAFVAAVPGQVLYLDCVTNNPGAAGGAVVDLQGRLVGLIGKELTAESTDMFVNFAIPAEQLAAAYAALRGGPLDLADDDSARVRQPHRLGDLGLTLVPDVLLSTPPYVDAVTAGGSAARAGLQPDDLIVEAGGAAVRNCRDVRQRLAAIDRIDPVKLRVLRAGKLIDVELTAEQDAP